MTRSLFLQTITNQLVTIKKMQYYAAVINPKKASYFLWRKNSNKMQYLTQEIDKAYSLKELL